VRHGVAKGRPAREAIRALTGERGRTTITHIPRDVPMPVYASSGRLRDRRTSYRAAVFPTRDVDRFAPGNVGVLLWMNVTIALSRWRPYRSCIGV